MNLEQFFTQVYQPYRLRGKSINSVRLYRLTINQFGRSLGRPAELSDLTDANILLHLQRRIDVSPATRNKELAQLSALWRLATQRGKHTGWPGVPAEPEPERVPVAWTRSDIDQLLATVRGQSGKFGTIPRPIYWESMIRLALDTGERISALRSARWTWLEDPWILFPSEYRKGNKRDKSYRLSAPTITILHDQKRFCDSAAEIFPWPYSPTYIWRCWRELLAAAGLPQGRSHGFHRLRKTMASVAYAAGHDPQDLLDHSDRRTTQRYLDPRFARKTQASCILAEWLRNPPAARERAAQ